MHSAAFCRAATAAGTAAAKTDGPRWDEWKELRFLWITWFGVNAA